MSRKTILTSGSVRFLAMIGLVVLILATAAPSPEEIQSAEQNSQNQNTQQNNQNDEQQNQDAENSNQNNQESNQNLIEQGKYLVHDVAKCVVCHSPKDNNGNVIKSRLLQGAPIPVDNPYPNQPWAFRAPELAGLPGGWNAESLVTFLTTGKTPTGHAIRWPMPSFRMKKEDAQAVVAYLQSLK